MSSRNGSRPAADVEVAIIGAGIGGLGVGSALRRAGIDDFAIFERADDIGGTWRDNTYPGVGVDIPTFAYQFSYDLKPDWSRAFAKGAEVKEYLDGFTDRQGLRPHLRLNSEVASRTWDENEHVWRLEVNGEHVRARYVVSAIGAFVDPKPAEIDGIESFAGKLVHSARWDHSYELAGKRVAVIGTGASAVQIVPEIASEVEQLDVYQRTPIWVQPKFDPEIPAWIQTAFRRVPLAQRAVYTLASAVTEFIITFMLVNYERLPYFVNRAEVDGRRWVCRFVKDPELRKKLIPEYGFGCKRPSVSNDYLPTFTRDNVELVTEGIERITPDGILTHDGTERAVDAIVLATGFRLASDPETFRRTPVRGREGFDLAAQYERERVRSYEGVSMPGLPNHFMVFGPYGWNGASWHAMVENTSRHVIRVIREAKRRGATAVEVTPEATERFFALVQKRLRGSIWAVSNCEEANSYYFDHHGDTTLLRPTSSWQMRHAARRFSVDDYRFERLAPDRARAEGELRLAD